MTHAHQLLAEILLHLLNRILAALGRLTARTQVDQEPFDLDPLPLSATDTKDPK